MTTRIPNPPWLVAKADQRVASVEHLLPLVPVDAHVLMALTEPPENCTPEQYRTWDRSCDCCGVYVPDGENLWTGHALFTMPAGHKIRFTFGICDMCKAMTSG